MNGMILYPMFLLTSIINCKIFVHNKTFYLPDHFITGTLITGWRISYVLDILWKGTEFESYLGNLIAHSQCLGNSTFKSVSFTKGK